MNNRTFLLVAASFLVLSVGSLSAVGAEVHDTGPDRLIEDNDTRTKQFTGFYGVEYTATLNTSTDQLTVELYNPTNSTREQVPVVLHVYDRRYNATRITLGPNERWTETWELSGTLDIGRTNHSVGVYGLGENASARFNFTKDIEPNNTGEYPVPKIVNTELVVDPTENKNGLNLAVTIKNRGRQSYSIYLYVHTNQTVSNPVIARVPPDKDYHTAYVPLQEDPGDRVMGEVRLYRGSVQNDSGIRDQIYFEGSLEEGVAIRNESFEPIRPPYEENSYEFTPNVSGESRGGSLGTDVLFATAVAFGAVVGVSLVVGLLFRLR